MAVEKQSPRTIPWCTIILVTGALTCHTLVLLGNLATAKTFGAIGASTSGWSSVGLGLSGSMKDELDSKMTETVTILTDSLKKAVEVNQLLDTVLGTSANSTDEANSLLQNPKMHTHQLKIVENASKPQHVMLLSGAHLETKVQIDKKLPQLAFIEIQPDAGMKMHKEVSHLQKANASQLPFDISLPVNITVDNVAAVKEALEYEVTQGVDHMKKVVKEFMEKIKPALETVGAWLHRMGEKMMGTIEQFSTTIDRVQKIFDQIMSKMSGASVDKEILIHNTFTLFDTSNTGKITMDDLHEVGGMYGITAFNGEAGEKLHAKYDVDNDGGLTREEYSNMVDDESIPSAMTYVLRQFSKKLAQVAGNVAAARKRDEVASTVVEYLTLMAAKNQTKVSWISERLTNGSLVKDFTADVLKQLAQNLENPVQLTKKDVGQCVVDEMLRLDPAYTQECFDLMSEPDWWESQGFDLSFQPDMVAQVSKWFANSPNAPVSDSATATGTTHHHGWFHAVTHSLGLALTQEEVPTEPVQFMELTARSVHKAVYKRVRRHKAQKHKKSIEYHNMVFASASAEHLYKGLLGVKATAGGGEDEDVEQALNSGVDALPETLEFAHFLSLNASATAKRFEGYAFDYAKTSSNVLESFANQVKGMVNKVSGFLNTMMQYSTPRGIQELEDKVEDFVSKAGDTVLAKVNGLVDSSMEKAFSGAQLAQVRSRQVQVPSVDDMGDVIAQVTGLMKEFKNLLPTVIDDLKFARKEVSAVSKTLDTVFTSFQSKGSPIFDQVSSLYTTLWTVYYVFFALMTCTLLFYGFWASGWFGGPAQVDDEGPPAPTSMKERCIRCCRACNWCMHTVHNTHLCFWSCMLLSEIIILVMFVISIVLCLLAGVKVFINVGCAQIYILGDDDVCKGTLGLLQQFLLSFFVNQNLQTACDENTLTTCKHIMNNMMKSAIYTSGGSFMAAVFSFQMLFESASLHERARWLYLANTYSKQ